jgi:hypothetical protein
MRPSWEVSWGSQRVGVEPLGLLKADLQILLLDHRDHLLQGVDVELAGLPLHLGLEVAVEIEALEIFLGGLDQGFFHGLEHILFGDAFFHRDHLDAVEETGRYECHDVSLPALFSTSACSG